MSANTTMEKTTIIAGVLALSVCCGSLLLNQRGTNYTDLNTENNDKMLSNKGEKTEFPDEIKDELFSRVKMFFSDKGFDNLQQSFIIVVGLGGVGSHCAHMLARSGVGKLRLIDFDQVTLSSLNRHAVATMSDVGISKAEAIRKRLLDIIPWCDIEGIAEMFKIEEASRLLSGAPTMVIDCIDDVNTKAELIAFCIKNDIPILTSMGAGGKGDPTRLRISSLLDCINDPLASKIKWRLKKYHQLTAEKVMTVFSVEKPMCNLLPLDDEQALAPQDFGAADYLRVRVMPVLGTSPSIFGQALASYVLCSLAEKPYDPEVGERISKKLKHKLRQVFRNNELARFGTDNDIDMDDDDMEFIIQQVWRSRCAVTNARFGGHTILVLTRWDPLLPPTPYNLVLLMQRQATLLAEQGQAAFNPTVVAKITERLAWAKHVCDSSWETLDHCGGSANQTGNKTKDGKDLVVVDKYAGVSQEQIINGRAVSCCSKYVPLGQCNCCGVNYTARTGVAIASGLLGSMLIGAGIGMNLTRAGNR